MTYQLYAAPLSLYSGKLRGYMRWKNIPFRETPSTRAIYRNTIIPRVGYPVVPVMITPDDNTLQDTTDIIDYLESHETGPSIYPTGPKQKLAALILELFGDEWLLMAAMHYRWNYNKEFAWGEFGKTLLPNLSKEEQIAEGRTASGRFMGMLPMLGITPKTIPAVEASYEQFLSDFNAHLETHPYLFGTRPSIGDYGLLGPLYAHNYRDPASGEIMKRLAPNVAEWCLRTHAPQEMQSGEFLEEDTIPETLLPILRMFAREHLPILKDTATHLQTWASDNAPGMYLPRALGEHTALINGIEETRAVLPYQLWMLQRVTDHIKSLRGRELEAAQELLTSIGAQDLNTFENTPRLNRRNFKLVLA